jgi:hypothetical protein
VLLIIMTCSLQPLGDTLILPILVIATLLGNELLSFFTGRYHRMLARKMQANAAMFEVYEDTGSHKGQKLLQNVSEI